MMTEKAKRKTMLFLKEFYTSAKVGNGGDSSNPNASDLDVPITTSSSFAGSESDENVIDFFAQFNNLEGETIREFGIFGSLPTDAEMANLGSGTWTTGNVETVMLARINFDALGPFVSGDVIDITLVAEVE